MIRAAKCSICAIIAVAGLSLVSTSDAQACLWGCWNPCYSCGYCGPYDCWDYGCCWDYASCGRGCGKMSGLRARMVMRRACRQACNGACACGAGGCGTCGECCGTCDDCCGTCDDCCSGRSGRFAAWVCGLRSRMACRRACRQGCLGGCGYGCNGGDCGYGYEGGYVPSDGAEGYTPGYGENVVPGSMRYETAPSSETVVPSETRKPVRSPLRRASLITSRQEDDSARFSAAVRLYHEQRLGEALEALLALTEAEPNNALAFYYLALTHYDMGDIDAANTELAKAAEIECQEAIANWGRRMQRVQGRRRVWLENGRRSHLAE